MTHTHHGCRGCQLSWSHNYVRVCARWRRQAGSRRWALTRASVTLITKTVATQWHDLLLKWNVPSSCTWVVVYEPPCVRGAPNPEERVGPVPPGRSEATRLQFSAHASLLEALPRGRLGDGLVRLPAALV